MNQYKSGRYWENRHKVSTKGIVITLIIALIVILGEVLRYYIQHKAYFFRASDMGYEMSDLKYSLMYAFIMFAIRLVEIAIFLFVMSYFLLIIIVNIVKTEKYMKLLQHKKRIIILYAAGIFLISFTPLLKQDNLNHKVNHKYKNPYQIIAEHLKDLSEKPVTVEVSGVNVNKTEVHIHTSNGGSREYYIYNMDYNYEGKLYSAKISQEAYDELKGDGTKDVTELTIYPNSKLIKEISKEEYAIIHKSEMEKNELINGNRVIDGITKEYPFILNITDDYKLNVVPNEKYHEGKKEEFPIEDLSLIIELEDQRHDIAISTLSDIELPHMIGRYQIMIGYLNGKVASNSISFVGDDEGVITEIEGEKVEIKPDYILNREKEDEEGEVLSEEAQRIVDIAKELGYDVRNSDSGYYHEYDYGYKCIIGMDDGVMIEFNDYDNKRNIGFSYEKLEKPFYSKSGYHVEKAKFVISYTYASNGELVPKKYVVGYEAVKGKMYIRIWNVYSGLTDEQGLENAKAAAEKFGILP